jgi:hypothetical protein
MPGSAAPEDQLADAGIDSRAITSAALTLARARSSPAAHQADRAPG